MPASQQRCGYVAVVGRPNVGKSTLVNAILGQKLMITSEKPQTTRHKVLGIKTEGADQVVYVDTPGLHMRGRSAINRYMNRTADAALADVDIVVMVVQALRWKEEDANVLERLRAVAVPVILAINKVDLVKQKAELLPFLEETARRLDFDAVVPVSAKTGTNIGELEAEIRARLPCGVHLFPEDFVTDRSERFLVAELVREKLMRALEQELPYAVTVQIERFEQRENLIQIEAKIWVERKSQKRIVVGKGGQRLKEIGRQARVEIESLLGHKVFLKLWVGVQERWSEDDRTLKRFGYEEEP